MRTTEKLLSLLEEYFNLIAKMQKSNQLEKSLASINIRRQIEQMNSAVLVECNILDEKHEHILQVRNHSEFVVFENIVLIPNRKKGKKRIVYHLKKRTLQKSSSKILMDWLCGRRI